MKRYNESHATEATSKSDAGGFCAFVYTLFGWNPTFIIVLLDAIEYGHPGILLTSQSRI